MRYEFSLPIKSDKVLTGSDWIHEIKQDGYRVLLIRDQERVRLISRSGHDWGKQFPTDRCGRTEVTPEAFCH
jgi:bifunctional non-homologous end joining protein LigD